MDGASPPIERVDTLGYVLDYRDRDQPIFRITIGVGPKPASGRHTLWISFDPTAPPGVRACTSPTFIEYEEAIHDASGNWTSSEYFNSDLPGAICELQLDKIEPVGGLVEGRLRANLLSHHVPATAHSFDVRFRVERKSTPL